MVFTPSQSMLSNNFYDGQDQRSLSYRPTLTYGLTFTEPVKLNIFKIDIRVGKTVKVYSVTNLYFICEYYSHNFVKPKIFVTRE